MGSFGGVLVAATKKDRNAMTETMITAILHSCCFQKVNHTMSTVPACLTPALLMMATRTITSDKQSVRLNPAFCHLVIRKFHRRATGNETTRISEVTSIAVLMDRLRIVQCVVNSPVHAVEILRKPIIHCGRVHLLDTFSID